MWGKGWCYNPSGSRPNFFGRQHLTFDKGGKGVGDFRGIVRIWEGWVCGEGLLSFCNGCGNREVRCNGRSKLAPLRKANGMVRFCEGWCGNPSGSRPNFFGDSTSPLTRGGKNVVRSEGGASNPSGSRPNSFGRQHLTFDKGGKCDGVGQGLVRRFIC